jgi:hypothetical protein
MTVHHDHAGNSRPRGDLFLGSLVPRNDETLAQLLTRLDLAIGKAFTEDLLTDEINTPLRNSHRR